MEDQIPVFKKNQRVSLLINWFFTPLIWHEVKIELGNLNILAYTIQLANSTPLLLPAHMSQVCSNTILHRDLFIKKKKVWGRKVLVSCLLASVSSYQLWKKKCYHHTGKFYLREPVVPCGFSDFVFSQIPYIFGLVVDGRKKKNLSLPTSF